MLEFAKVSEHNMNEHSPFRDQIFIKPIPPKRNADNTPRILIHPVPQDTKQLIDIPIQPPNVDQAPSSLPTDSPSPLDSTTNSVPNENVIEQQEIKSREKRLKKLCLEHQSLLDKIRDGEYVPLSRLLFTFQGLERIRDIGRLSVSEERQPMAEAQFRFALVELRKMRHQNASDDEIYRAVLDRFYNPDRFRYKVNDNDLFRAFAPEPRPDHKGRPTGNCESRATAMAALLEAAQVGNQVLLETFSDHVRVVAQDRDGNRFVLENAAPTPYTPTPGTKLVPLSDLKSSLAGIPPSHVQSFELGTHSYHERAPRDPKKNERTVQSITSKFGGKRPFGIGSSDDAAENPSALDQLTWKASGALQPAMENIYRRLFSATRGHLPTITQLKRAVPAVIAGLFLTGAFTHAKAEEVSTPEEAVDLIHQDISRLTGLITSIAEKIEQALSGKDPNMLTATVQDPEDKPFQPTSPKSKLSIGSPDKSFTVFLVDDDYKKAMVEMMTQDEFTYSWNDFLMEHTDPGVSSKDAIVFNDHVRTTTSDFWKGVVLEMNTSLNVTYQNDRGVDPMIAGTYTIYLQGKNLDPIRVMDTLWAGAQQFDQNWTGNRRYPTDPHFTEQYPAPKIRSLEGSLTVYVNGEAIVKDASVWGGELDYVQTPISLAWEDSSDNAASGNVSDFTIPPKEVAEVRSEIAAKFGMNP